MAEIIVKELPKIIEKNRKYSQKIVIDEKFKKNIDIIEGFFVY